MELSNLFGALVTAVLVRDSNERFDLTALCTVSYNSSRP